MLSDAIDDYVSWWYNDECERKYGATLASRGRGFTQAWGNLEGDSNIPEWFHIEQQDTGRLISQPYPKAMVTLFQFRVSWKELWALQTAGADFTVVNMEWSHTEACGMLPAWQEGQHFAGCEQSSIWQFVAERKGFNIDDCLSESQLREIDLWRQKLDLLSYICVLIECQYDWESAYRKETSDLSTASGDTIWRSVLAVQQVAAVRRLRLRRLPRDVQRMSYDRAIQTARQLLTNFSRLLGNQRFLFGTPKPTSLDVELWSLLMESTRLNGSVTRGMVKECDNLVEFARLLYVQMSQSWTDWNRQQVENNISYPRPLLWMGPKKMNAEHQVDIQRVFYDPYETWNRWSMGGSFQRAASLAPDQPKTHEEKAKLDAYRRQDELWLSTVAALTLAVAVGMQLLSAAPTRSSVPR